MKRIISWLIVLFITFGLGVTTTFFTIRYSQNQAVTKSELTVENHFASNTSSITKVASPIEESPEAKAVRIAEEFVVQNGYTDLPADKRRITHETVEFARNLDELLKSRANTLERKAYGILYKATGTKMGEKGWTVVFQSKIVSDDYYESTSQATGKKITRESHPIGRAVTMDANFQNLLVEHKDFPLHNVDKKLLALLVVAQPGSKTKKIPKNLIQQFVADINDNENNFRLSEADLEVLHKNLKCELNDLNGDGISEFFLFIDHSDWCGAGSNCSYWVYQKTKDGYNLLVEDKVLRVKETLTNGYQDLSSETPMGFCERNVQRVSGPPYKFDGERYQAQRAKTECQAFTPQGN